MTFVWLVGYPEVVAMTRDFLRQSNIRGFIEGLTDTLLNGLGLRIATERR